MRPWAILAAALAVALATSSCYAFKEQDFKKCSQANFCARNRGLSAKFSVVPSSVSHQGHTLAASLLNEQYKKQIQLWLVAYDDGFVRLLVDEGSQSGRYRVQEIVMEGVEERKAAWSKTKQDASGVTLQFGQTTATLSFQPFQLAISINGVPAVTINSRNLFNFEHRRSKQEGDPDGWWEETFNGHRDSKPMGPEAISLDIAFPGFAHVYGIPERATSLALKPTAGSGAAYSEPYRLYNLDVFEYLDDSAFGLYGSIPVMLAHKQGLTTGVLWLNAAEMFVDVEKVRDGVATQWIVESGIVDLFIFVGPTPTSVMQQYAKLTGPSALPQLFALGYHQCRWNYRDEADVRAVDAGFDQHEIPYDVLWLDIEHTNGKRYLTWDASLFPQPVQMQEDIASRGRKMVTIVDPHVKRDYSYYIFSEAEKSGYYVKNRDGRDFDGWCWPGQSSYLDVSNPTVRQWWAEQFPVDKYQGSTRHLYIWNDMNEPSVFNGPEITMHKDNKHWGGVEHRDVHNLYGLQYHQGTAAGLELRGWRENPDDGDRPFVLSRAFFAGTQRVGPIWTGDNAADWKHLRVSLPMLLTLGVSGLPFSGADVGGFFGNPDVELLTRWYQVGAYYPFFRGHAHLETQRREPWLFGEEATARIRAAIRQRYALLPYIYTLFRQANVSGLPLMRPMWFDFPDNKDTFAIDSQFMLGPGLLVAPVLGPGVSTVDVMLPKGSRWFHGITGQEAATSSSQTLRVPVTLDAIPTYYQGGHIVPRRERPRRSTATMALDPFTLVVAADAAGAAEGELYLDDGSSFAFQRGAYLHRRLTLAGKKLTNAKLVLQGVPDGTLISPVQIERVVFLGLPPQAGGYQAKLPSGEVVPLEEGPLSHEAPASTAAYVLRKPLLKASDDWTVEII